MLVPPQVFELHKLTDAGTSRYCLGGIRFERDDDGHPVAIATDGRKLLAIQWPEPPADKYPADKVGLSAEHKLGFETIVPAKACQKAAKLPPRSTCKPILKNVLLDETATNGSVPMGAYDLEEAQQVRPQTLAGKYVKWRDVYPRPTEEDRTVTVKLDARAMADLLTTITKASGDKDCRVNVTFHLSDPTDNDGEPVPMASRAWENPVIVSAQSSDGALLSGVIMPFGFDKPVPNNTTMEPVWVPKK